MGREIKFRVWDSVDKYMISPYEMDDLCVDGYGCVYSDLGANVDGSGPRNCIMQYTGLKDKNGVEIYEGDVCSKQYSSGTIEVCYIKFIDGMFCGYFDDDPGAYFCIDADKQEVIGNIYENKELLNE